MLRFHPASIESAHAVSFADRADYLQYGVAGAGLLRPAGQLADCHFNVPVRLVAVGQRRFLHLYTGGCRRPGGAGRVS